jgi:uncharacterized protein (TIGR00299 family) protein
MKIAYLECFAGIAGDMFLGALVDAGVDVHLLEHAAESLGLGVKLDFQKVDRSGIQSTKARVLIGGKDADGGLAGDEHGEGHTHEAHSHTHSHADENGSHSHSHSHSHSNHDSGHSHAHPHVHGRSLSEIRELISQAAITPGAKRIALDAFQRLGEAEAKIHGVSIETIHFHEVGAVDAIVDIVCAAAGADALGVDEWHCSAVNTGSGFVDCAHGRFPVPAPATIALLSGVPVYADGPAKELTTPTGAALLQALGCRFSGLPVLQTTAIGYGAGTRNPERFPNVLRLRIGDAESRLASTSTSHIRDTVTVLECAIDDATPEVLSYASQQLLEHGALDVMQQPVFMKKGRIGTMLTVLSEPASAGLFEDLLFRETTTLGVRRREEQRSILERSQQTVETDFGPIRVKVGRRDGEVLNVAPEFEDCKEAAQRHGVPLKEVMQAASAAARQIHDPVMEGSR